MMADAHPGILAIFNNAASGREAEFEEWFQHEHLAERIAVPGFLLGRRYEALSGQPRYFNFYIVIFFIYHIIYFIIFCITDYIF